MEFIFQILRKSTENWKISEKIFHPQGAAPAGHHIVRTGPLQQGGLADKVKDHRHLDEDLMPAWIDACATDDIDEEDLIRFDHAGATYAIYHGVDGKFYATEGLCSHEQVHLCDGLVMGNLIECPKHNGQFDYRTGEAKRAPVCINLRTFPVRVEGDRVLIELP
jgi:3-phenylpropionate/trans-cinnamate dioxygenase ferredoxin subunit